MSADVSCATGKVRYAAMGAARRALSDLRAHGRLRRRADDQLQPYWCMNCGGVHLGHPKPADRRRRQGRRRPDALQK